MILPTIPAWHEHVACTESDPELWFADDRVPHRIQAAKDICADCPVSNLCLEDALSRGEKFGVWGGHDFGKAARIRHEAINAASRRRMRERKAS